MSNAYEDRRDDGSSIPLGARRAHRTRALQLDRCQSLSHCLGQFDYRLPQVRERTSKRYLRIMRRRYKVMIEWMIHFLAHASVVRIENITFR